MILYSYEITSFTEKVVRASDIVYSTLDRVLQEAAKEHQPVTICIHQAQYVVKAPLTFFEPLLGE